MLHMIYIELMVSTQNAFGECCVEIQKIEENKVQKKRVMRKNCLFFYSVNTYLLKCSQTCAHMAYFPINTCTLTTIT